MKKLLKAALLLLAVISAAAYGNPNVTYAKDNTAMETEEISGVMTLLEDASAREQADTNANELFALKEGESIFVTGETDNGWYRFVKNGSVAYVECDKVNNPGVDEALVKELNEQVETAVKDINQINRYREEASKSKIWGAVIVVLVIAIFAVGIITTLKKQKEEKEKINK